MDRIWLQAPLPAVRLRMLDEASVAEPNPAALGWAQAAGFSAEGLCAAVQAQAPWAEGPCELSLGSLSVQGTAVALGEATLLWLQPTAGDPAAPITQARRATEFLDRALVLAGVSVWRVDLATRRIHFNAVGFQVRSMDQDPAGIDLDVMRSTIHPDDLPAVLLGAEEALASDRVVDVVARYRDVDGGWRTLLTRRVAERDSHGRALGLAGISLDWSQQLADRQRALTLADQARLASLASREKSAFMARMSHELRTPMNAVLGFAQLLNSDLEEPPSARQRQRLAQILDAGQRLLALIDDLLAIAHREMDPLPASGAPELHVLCVEDNPVNLQLVRELMALRPVVRLRTAVDGNSGLAAALAERPDLLLLDLQLPDIDGIEVMRRLRGEPSMQGCRIVALSADAMPEHIEAARKAGFDDYWTKPIEFDSFLAQIDRLASRRAG